MRRTDVHTPTMKPWAFGVGLCQQYPPWSSRTSPPAPARKADGGLSVHGCPVQGLGCVVDVVERTDDVDVEVEVVDEVVVVVWAPAAEANHTQRQTSTDATVRLLTSASDPAFPPWKSATTQVQAGGAPRFSHSWASMAASCSMRGWWRPPSNSVSRNRSTTMTA